MALGFPVKNDTVKEQCERTKELWNLIVNMFVTVDLGNVI